MKDEIHIGKMISDKMKEEGRSVQWLAEKLSCSRSNIYKPEFGLRAKQQNRYFSPWDIYSEASEKRLFSVYL